ncbi:MAG TPA: type II secretion system protein [Usitatibacter sp.]|nr:type II secretion system protein [Usitatibacter sp.]
MSSSPCPERSRAFTLIEVMVVIVILTLLLSGIALPLAAQLQMRRGEETRRALAEAREAILGFAAAHGRLPCPASESSAGEESFAPGGDASNGACSHFYGGYLPGATLGLSPLDSQGFVRDAWGSPANRVRYAVFGGGFSVGGVANPLTRGGGMRTATLPALGAAPHYLYICSTGASASASGCGPAANQLTRRAAFVLLSLGANAGSTPAAGSDEARNLAATPVFVYREPSGDGFDDVVHWAPVHLVVNRLLSAGLLP